MALAGLCSEPALLGFALPGLEGMKQPQGLDGLCGEGAAWEHWLVGAALFFLVDLEAPVQPQSLSVEGMCVGGVCSQRGNLVCLGKSWEQALLAVCEHSSLLGLWAPQQSRQGGQGHICCSLCPGVFCLFRLTQEITLYEAVFSLWEMMNVLHVTEQPRGSSLGRQYQKCCVNVMLENSWSKFCFM